MRLKEYEPEEKIKSFLTKNKININSNSNFFNKLDSPIHKKLSLTSKSTQKKVIEYNFQSNAQSFGGMLKLNLPKKYRHLKANSTEEKSPKSEHHNITNINNNIFQLHYKKDEDKVFLPPKLDEFKLNNKTKIVYKNFDIDNIIKNNDYINQKYKFKNLKLSTIESEYTEKKISLMYVNYIKSMFFNIIYKASQAIKNKNLPIVYQSKEMRKKSFGEERRASNMIELCPDKEYIYIGEKKNNIKNGYGLELFKNSNSYFFGRFINGKRRGLGKYTRDSNNYSYSGEVDDIYAYGYGIFINKYVGKEYEGEWKESKKNGIGIEKYINNTYYKGEFSNGKREGIGEYYGENNIFYEGQWKNNLMDGYGIYKFSNGSIYKGGWKNNKMDGFGILNNKNKTIYVGFYKDSFNNGFGLKIDNVKNKAYVGFWKNNKQNGFGKIFYNNKITYGIWKNGIIDEKVTDKNKLENILKNINEKYLDFFILKNFTGIKKKIDEFLN